MWFRRKTDSSAVRTAVVVTVLDLTPSRATLQVNNGVTEEVYTVFLGDRLSIPTDVKVVWE